MTDQSETSDRATGDDGGDDVVSLLLNQHARIRELCDAVAHAPAPAARRQPFDQLLRLMVVHEAVEEEIVHPYVRRRVTDSASMIDERLREENAAKKMLVALDALGPDNAAFPSVFAQFHTSVLEHAAKEEDKEFAGLRAGTRPAERKAMAAAVKVAAALAPTHPHPGLESAPRNLLVGTPLAMIDRARDLIRDAMATRNRPDGGSAEAGGDGPR